jgi:hypothetical protein
MMLGVHRYAVWSGDVKWEGAGGVPGKDVPNDQW